MLKIIKPSLRYYYYAIFYPMYYTLVYAIIKNYYPSLC